MSPRAVGRWPKSPAKRHSNKIFLFTTLHRFLFSRVYFGQNNVRDFENNVRFFSLGHFWLTGRNGKNFVSLSASLYISYRHKNEILKSIVIIDKVARIYKYTKIYVKYVTYLEIKLQTR